MSAEFDLSMRLGDAEFKAAGSPELVKEALDEFKALLDHTPVTRQPAQEAAQPTASGGQGSKPPFAIFMKRNWPNQAATATAVLTWAKRHDGKDRLKPGEMAEYWKRFGKKPGNPTFPCQSAEKKGWLEQLGGGYYAVTGHGEAMVDETAAPEA